MMTATDLDQDRVSPSQATLGCRYIAWSIVGLLFAFLANVYLKFWQDWPGFSTAFSGGGGLAWLQLSLYVAALAAPAAFVLRAGPRSLRADAETISALTAYIVRAAFWAVLLVGLADAVISFLRVEGFLEPLLGKELTQSLGRSQFRGPYVHMPLIGFSLLIALRSKTLGFTWLTLLVVLAELQIVVTRFVFSYEQAFMGDLVRFWYGSLFLFASAYTLIEEGHVRVDVFYAAFSDRTKGIINAAGSMILGIPLCWVILIIGFGQKSSIITSPILAFEVTQAGFGMYVKYLLAAVLAVFAITMMTQFVSYFLEGVADYRGDPGKRRRETESAAH